MDMAVDAAIEAVALALQIDERQVWGQFLVVSRMHLGLRPARFASHCPVVVIRGMAGVPESAIQDALAGVGASIAAALDLPLTDVWVSWEELRPGRVFAGAAIQG